MMMGHATVASGVDIPSDVVAAALKWHDVQRQRCEKKSAAFYDSVVMRRKGPSRKDKIKCNKGYAKEQERQNERKLLVQKWVWEEHVNQQEVFQATMRIDRDERNWEPVDIIALRKIKMIYVHDMHPTPTAARRARSHSPRPLPGD